MCLTVFLNEGYKAKQFSQQDFVLRSLVYFLSN